MYEFIVNSGLGGVQAENLIFTLALSSAMLRGQSGRDISDKDIERFLRLAGADATSMNELTALLEQLEKDAINYVNDFTDITFLVSGT